MLILKAAYGRVYNTLDDAMADWNDGKDFKIHQGPYCSKRDLPKIAEMNHQVVIVAGDKFQFRKIICNG